MTQSSTTHGPRAHRLAAVRTSFVQCIVVGIVSRSDYFADCQALNFEDAFLLVFIVVR